MTLKAVKPDVQQKRLKLLVYGPTGVGKTTACIQFPTAYILDCERGTDFYATTINKSGSVVLQSNSSDDILQELRTLLTTKHPYTTLIVDPLTQIYNAVQEKWTRVFEKHAKTQKEAEIQDFGPRYWGRVKSEMKAIERALMALDMNVLVTSHQKDIYGPGMTKLGVGADAQRGVEYLFDLIFELKKVGDKRIATKIKERAELGNPKFPDEFEWSYENFCRFYGSDILKKESKPVAMATPEQVQKIEALLRVVNIPEEEVAKWLEKEEADNFSQMRAERLEKCIEYVSKKLKQIQEVK